jgi:hypothetical protein
LTRDTKTEADENGSAEQFINVELADLAVTFGLPAKRFQEELAKFGWGMILDEANRLAHVDEFDRMTELRKQNKERVRRDVHPTWAHLVQAAKEFLPHLASRVPGTPTSPPDRLTGYVYVLFDGMTGLSKIGHTKTAGRRQRAQMGGHGSPIVNVVNVKVTDCLAAETQCHEHFAQYRTNGEWFSAKLAEIIHYVETELDWLGVDYENQETLEHYIHHCQSGNREDAKAVLREGRSRHSRLKPTSGGHA